MEVEATAEGANQQVSKNDSNPNGAAETSFDCSICLDSAVDPVVTLCGHLYCWQCIYNWMKPQTSGSTNNPCPVCKSPLSESTLIPLYGRGRNNSQQDSAKIPNRRSIPHEMFDSVIQPAPQQHHRYHHQYPHSSEVAASVLHSNAGGVLCGMADAILPWLLRDNALSMGSSSLSPYLLDASGNNPRLRRQELQVEIWLHQFWLFLFCCVFLCFLFF